MAGSPGSKRPAPPSLFSSSTFAREGFQIYLCPFNSAKNAKLFLDYAKEHGGSNILGVMETTWTPVKWFMDGLEGKPLEQVSWFGDSTPYIVKCYDWLFRPEEYEKLPPLPEDED